MLRKQAEFNGRPKPTTAYARDKNHRAGTALIVVVVIHPHFKMYREPEVQGYPWPRQPIQVSGS
jgi:hypothetical protein